MVREERDEIEIREALNELPRAERSSVLHFFRKSAAYAALKDPASWAITFRPKSARSLLRLNIAQWRAIDLWNEEEVPQVGVEFFGERLTLYRDRALQ